MSQVTKYQMTPAELASLRAAPVKAATNRAGLPTPRPFTFPARKPKETKGDMKR
ncbi:hypothetical protein COHCIP112018_02371 [Cohnella sp. JJ-181]|nr:hypothetical protein COHCIP112018_02371 [Cohnella sp. JJ-181]